MSAALSRARMYVKRGWALVPVPRGQKAPRERDWPNFRITIDDLPRYFANGSNIGVLTGEPSGQLIDTDLDWDSAARLASEFLPPTDLISGRNRRPESHYWYTSNERTKKFVNPAAPDNEKAMIVEIRSSGCQTVVAPSTHPDGDKYHWDAEGEAAPVAGPDLVRAAGKLAACCLTSLYWTKGRRHAMTLPLAGMLCRAGWSQLDTEHFIRCVASEAGDPETSSRLSDVRTTYEASRARKPTTGIPALKKLLPSAVVDSIVNWLQVPTHEADTQSVAVAGFKIPGIEMARGRTDSANALRLVAHHGDDIRYCPGWSKYLVWDRNHWERDAAHRIEAFAKTLSSALWQEIVEAGKANADKVTINAMIAFARRSSDSRGLREMIWAARSEESITADHVSLDAQPFLLNVQNGTLDLEQGRLREHSRNDLITKLAPVVFDPSAKCPTWIRFLEEVFQPAPELGTYLQRAFGYSLTGSTIERCLFFLLGIGLNGKTTAVTVLQKLLGSYATSITTELLMLAHGQQHPTEMCDLAGVRMAVAAETEDGRRFAESLVKQLTGGEDRLKGRRMREDFWEFTATHKLWLTGNHKPKVSTSDEAIWDRLRIIPFTTRFDNPDRSLAKKLEQELPGILNWALAGCLDWQRDGLPTPSIVERATIRYRQEMDSLGAFLNECCHINQTCRAGATALFTSYTRWGGDLSQKAFGSALAERKFVSGRFKSGKNKGRKYWSGIGLVDEEQTESGE